MSCPKNIYDSIKAIGIVPVVKLTQIDKAIPLADALRKGGINCAEITFRAEGADSVIKNMTTAFPDMIVGAGTVTTIEQVDKAQQSGATFCVSPALNENVVKHCQHIGMPIMAGVVTPTEIDRAIQLGLTYVKFFPAEQAGGLPYIKAVCAPYQGIQFMPTGGINIDNLGKYLSYNRIFACGGSFMVTADMLEKGDWDTVTKLSQQARSIIKQIRV